MPFMMPTKDTPTTLEGMWQLAKTFGQCVKEFIDGGQILALGMFMGSFYQRNMSSLDLTELPTCEISNWGILLFHERYGQWEFVTMTPFCNMIRAPTPFILIQTVREILTIGYLGSTPIICSSTSEKLCNGTIQNLRRMIEVI